MAWPVLVVSAVLEAVWATALGQSDGLREPIPTLVFVVAVVLSMCGLAVAVRAIPIGTAYAVWTGLGAALTVVWAAVVGDEALTVTRAIFLTMIVGAVIGLRLVPARSPDHDAPSGSGSPPKPG